MQVPDLDKVSGVSHRREESLSAWLVWLSMKRSSAPFGAVTLWMLMTREPIAPRRLCNPQCIANQQEKRQQIILRRITDEKFVPAAEHPEQKVECGHCRQGALLRCIDCAGCEQCCRCGEDTNAGPNSIKQ